MSSSMHVRSILFSLKDSSKALKRLLSHTAAQNPGLDETSGANHNPTKEVLFCLVSFQH